MTVTFRTLLDDLKRNDARQDDFLSRHHHPRRVLRHRSPLQAPCEARQRREFG